MPNPTKRPNCVACGETFTDEDVRTQNFWLVSMSMNNGPSFTHKTCVKPSVED